MARRGRRVFASVLALTLGAALFTAPAHHAHAADSFIDVPASHQFYADIEWLAAQRITTGWADGTFRPEASITRAAFAAFMYRMAGAPAYTPSAPKFIDVVPEHQFYREISWLAEQGITTGWTDGTFRPEEPIARDAIAAFLYRYSGSPTLEATLTYWDVTNRHPFYTEIAWMASTGISCGWPDGTFRPSSPTQRAAMAAFLHRFATGTSAQCEARIYDISGVNLPITLDEMVSMQQAGSAIDKKKETSMLRHAIDTSGASPDSADYYQFADLRSSTAMTPEQIDAFLASTALGRRGNLTGLGSLFVEAAHEAGINEAYLVAHAVLESGWGTSQLAQGYYYDGTTDIGGATYPAGTYYNFYGIGAVDSSPLSGGRAMAIKNGWNSRTKAIKGAAAWIAKNYVYRADAYGGQPTLYAMKWDYARASATRMHGWHQYASDEQWPVKIAKLMDTCYSYTGTVPHLSFIVPVYR